MVLRITSIISGEQRYQTLKKMSNQMRSYFEADPEDKDDALKGREIILDMVDLIKGGHSKGKNAL